MMEVWAPFILLALCTVGALAAPADTCAKTCVTVYNPKFKYDVGKVYTYSYETKSIIGVNGGAKEVPGVKLSANAEIHVITQCEFLLKLTNVKFQGNENPSPPNAGDIKKDLESQTLGFSFTDGRIDHICPNANDPVYSVNIKRAVLSAFQNSMDKGLESHVREADISGLCDTDYKIGKSANEIIKTKNIHSCTNRQGNFTTIQAKHYASSSSFQSSPILTPTLDCVHVLDGGLIKSVTCHEEKKFKMYSKGDKGAYTKTDTLLTYSKTGKSSAKSVKNFERSALFFDHADDTDVKSNKAETEKVLREICSNSEDGDIDGDSAELFTRLVYLIRRHSADDIRAFLTASKACKSPKAKDNLVSALVSAGTESALRVMVEILGKGELSKLRSKLWVLSLAFNARPTVGAIDAVTPLIEPEVPSRTALLAVSSLVYGYCRQHSDCEKEKAVLKVLDILGRNLGKKCRPKDDAEEDRIVVALKAFGNIGHVGKHENTILTCAKDQSLTTVIRLAAIEAFRRHPADEDVLTTFTNLLQDKKEDTEVRIASYLSLIKRATPKLIDIFEEIVNTEEVNQVTSFIYSHLKNLQETDSPLKENVKRLAQTVIFNPRHFSDPRKFSRNYETSFLSEKYNLGGTVDGNVIFSPDSFLPRSGMLNLTFDFFGSSVDLLELDIRTENFEHLLEKYFGPNGKFLQQTPGELLNEFRSRWRSIAQGIENEVADHDHSKHKRSTVGFLNDKRAPKAPAGEPHGSLSVKIFGNELRWHNFHKLDDVYDKSDPYNLQDILNKMAKHKEIDVARNWMFVDSTFVVPTASGFPLKWDLNGTMSLGLKLNSHFDIRDLFLRPRKSDIKSLIEPSVNIQYAASLTFDAHYGKVGLKVKSNVYSSTAIDGTLKLNEGEEFTIKLGLPKEKMTLFHYDADLYVVKGNSEAPAVQTYPERYAIKECSDEYGRANIFPSLDFCTSIGLPKPILNTERPFVPLGGRIEYDFSLIKREKNFKGVEFTALLKRDKTGDDVSNTEAKISFNTPGSTVDREYTIDYHLNRNDKTLKVDLKTPKRKLSLNGNYVDGENQKEGKMTLKVDNDYEYTLTGKTGVKRQGDKVVYTPVWEFTRPNSAKTIVSGTVSRVVGKKIEFDLKSDPSSERKVQIKGYAQRDGPLDFGEKFTAETEFQVVLPYIDTKFHGEIKNDGDDKEVKRDLDFKGEYTLLPGGDKRSGSLKWHRETKVGEGDFKLKQLVEVTTSRFPDYNIHMNSLLEKVSDQRHSFLEAKWGSNFEDPNHKLFFEHTNKLKRVGKNAYETDGKLQFVYPRRNINWDITGKFSHTPHKQIKYDLDMKYAADKTLKVHIDFQNKTTRLDNYQSEITIDLPTRQIAYRNTWQEKKANEYQGETYFQWQKGEHVTLNSAYKDKSTPGQSIHHEADVVVILYSNPKPIRKYNALVHLEHGKIILTGKVEKPDTTYLVDINYEYPAPYTANAKVDLKLPWIEGQAKSKRAPGEFDGTLDFKTEKRRVVGDAKLKGSDTKKVLTANLKWDAGRDESKKLALKADVERPRVRAASLHGSLELPSRTIKGDIKYELPYELFNGQHNVYVDLEYAPGKKATVDAKINVDKSDVGRRLSNGEIKLNTPHIQNLKVAYNTDFHKLPDQRSFKAHFNIDSTRIGNVILSVDHLRGRGKIDSSFEATYGGGKTIGAGIGAYFDVGSGIGFDVGGSFKLKTPLEVLKDIEITVREGFKRSSEYTHIIHDNHFRWAPEKEVGAAFEWTRKYDPEKGFEVGVRTQLDTPNPAFRHQKFLGEVEFRRDPIHIRSNFDVAWGADKKLKDLFFYKRDGGKIDVHVLFDARSIRPKAYVEAVYNRNPIGTDKYSSHGSVDYSDVKVTFVNKGHYSPEKKTADLVITFPESFFASKTVNLKGNLIVKGIQRNGDVTVSWGEDAGNNVHAKGDWTVSETGAVSGKITIDPSKLGVEKINIDISRQVAGPKRSYGAKLTFGPERVFDLGLDVNDKADDTGKTVGASVKVNGEDFITADIDLVDKKTKKHHFGRVLSYSATVNNQILSFTSEAGIFSEKGLNPFVKVCTIDKVKCLSFETLVDLHRWDTKVGPIDDTVFVKLGAQRGTGDSRTIGFIFHKSSVRNKYESYFKWLISEEEKKYIGYSYTKEHSTDKSKPGKTKVYQFLLPSRTIEARSDKTYTTDGFKYNLHLLLDAVRQPKTELLVSLVVKNSTAGSVFTRNSRLTIKHPKLTKELLVANVLKIDKENERLTLKSEVDLSSDPKKKVTVDLDIHRKHFGNSHDNCNTTYSLSIRSQTPKNLNGKISGYLVRGPEARTTNVVFYWLTKSGTPKVYTLHNDLDKVADTIDGYLRTPYREFSWDGVYRHIEDAGSPSINAHLDLKYNGKLFRRAAIDVSRGPEYNLKYFVDPSDTSRLFRLHGGLLDDNTYRWTATRVRDGKETQDVDILVKLNNTNLLYNRYTWRTGMLQDIREGIEARVDKVGDDVQQALQNVAGSFKEEVIDKVQSLRDLLKVDIVPLAKEARGKLAKALDELEADIKATNFDRLKDVLGAILGTFFDLETLNVKLDEIHANLLARIGGLKTKISETTDRLITRLGTLDDDIAAAFANLPDKIKALRANIKAKLPEIGEKIRDALIRIRDAINTIIDKQQISKGLESFRDVWDEAADRFKALLQRVFETLFGDSTDKVSLYERLRTRLWDYAEGEGQLAKVLKGVLTAIKSVKEKVQEFCQDVRQFLQDARKRLLESLSTVYKKLEENPDFKALMQEVSKYKTQLEEKYVKSELSVKERLRSAVDKILVDTRERVQQLVNDAVFDLKGGRIEYHVPLLVPIDSLRSVREAINLRQFWFELSRLSNQSSTFSVIDAYRRLRAMLASGRSDLLPPFDAQAMLIGNRHFMTYDKRFYDFDGKCQYILTRDFYDENFTVIINYDASKEAPEKISFLIISDSHHVEIKPGSTVILDQQEVELPIQIEATAIQRHWNIIRLENNMGFTLEYDVVHDIVTVNISGWYFGKTDGLFGNNNNDPRDDFRNFDGEVVNNVNVFANSWEISHYCPLIKNFATKARTKLTTGMQDICYELFYSENSTLHLCTSQVNPDHFFKVCLEEGTIEDAYFMNGICRAVAGYRCACSHHEVHVSMPNVCVRCETPTKQEFVKGEVKVLSGEEVPKSADVIFIMEQKECNRLALLESLDEISKEMDKELLSNGFLNNRYGIIGFGGDGSQRVAHSHTARGQMFTDAPSVILALKTMTFSSLADPSDTLSAIQLAAAYPFRTGIAKIAILYLCKRCSQTGTTTNYAVLQNNLLRQGMSLHILTPGEFELNLKKQPENQIIGIDAYTTYSVKDVDQDKLAGETSLRRHIADIDDICYTLSQSLNGSIFRSDLVSIRKFNLGRNVKSIFAKRVLDSVVSTNCQTCSCEADANGVGQPKCEPCDLPVLRSAINKYDDR